MLATLLFAKKYIVTTSDDAQVHANALNTFTFGGMNQGYIAELSYEEAQQVAQMAGVLSVEEDGVMKTMDVQQDAEWGLTRISHRVSGADAFLYPHNAGEGVTVYVVDTGINVEHEEFEGRAMMGQDFTEDADGIDGNGHGTHCSGTIGGKTYGIAKKANLIGVKVLSKKGYGSTSGVIQGIEWAFKHHKSRGKGAKSVINMSLGGGKSLALNRAIEAANKAGVVVSVAAGNENQDACNVSPASSEYAITVGATTAHDQRAWFSNWGKCLDIFAPGYKIKSTWKGSKTATNTISGTSMAAPHVAGVAAVYLSDNKEAISVENIRDILIKMSTKDMVKGLPVDKKQDPKWPFPFPRHPNHGKKGNTVNRLLYHPEERVMADSQQENHSVTQHPPPPPPHHMNPHLRHHWWHHFIPHHWKHHNRHHHKHHKHHKKSKDTDALKFPPLPNKFLASVKIKVSGDMTPKEAEKQAMDILKSLIF